MRIPPRQLYQVMTSFTRQLVDRLRQGTHAPGSTSEDSHGKITDHVRREAVLRQVTTEILSRITRLSAHPYEKTDIRIQNVVDRGQTTKPKEKRLVYDVIEENGCRTRRELRIEGTGLSVSDMNRARNPKPGSP